MYCTVGGRCPTNDLRETAFQASCVGDAEVARSTSRGVAMGAVREAEDVFQQTKQRSHVTTKWLLCVGIYCSGHQLLWEVPIVTPKSQKASVASAIPEYLLTQKSEPKSATPQQKLLSIWGTGKELRAPPALSL